MKLTSNNIWVTSDTHYDHANICRSVSRWGKFSEEGIFEVDKASTRDFPDLETMNSRLVEGINENVDANDWLIHLGDWSFGGFEKIEEFRSQINCKNIILMIGNHDHHIEKNKDDVKKLFTRVSHYEELDIKTVGKFVICHYPIISWNGLHKGVYMLHGHQHLNEEQKIGEGRRMDVGVDGSSEFRPYHINEIVDILEPRFSKKH
jgi:calcineurin-like phosphoesterase family protein